MNILNSWDAMSRLLPSRQTASALIIFTMAMITTGCAERTNTELFRALPEAEANRLVAFLDKHAIKATKLAGREGVAVMVSAASLAQAARLASEAGLPRIQYQGFGTVFQKDGLISSPLEERARLMFAISQQLESMLMEIEGVVEARVTVVVPERRYGRYTELPSAAVMIKHRDSLDAQLLQWKIRRMVASSVPGLVDGDAQQISLSFVQIDTDEITVATAAIPAQSVTLPIEENIETSWTWRQIVPIAALATCVVGVVLLWFRQGGFLAIRQRFSRATPH